MRPQRQRAYQQKLPPSVCKDYLRGKCYNTKTNCAYRHCDVAWDATGMWSILMNPSHDGQPICSLCLGYLCFPHLLSSDDSFKLDELDDAIVRVPEIPALAVSCCGHSVHMECLQRYKAAKRACSPSTASLGECWSDPKRIGSLKDTCDLARVREQELRDPNDVNVVAEYETLLKSHMYPELSKAPGVLISLLATAVLRNSPTLVDAIFQQTAAASWDLLQVCSPSRICPLAVCIGGRWGVVNLVLRQAVRQVKNRAKPFDAGTFLTVSNSAMTLAGALVHCLAHEPAARNDIAKCILWMTDTFAPFNPTTPSGDLGELDAQAIVALITALPNGLPTRLNHCLVRLYSEDFLLSALRHDWSKPWALRTVPASTNESDSAQAHTSVSQTALDVLVH